MTQYIQLYERIKGRQMKPQKHGTFRIRLTCIVIHVSKSYQLLKVVATVQALSVCNPTSSETQAKREFQKKRFLFLATHTY